MSLQTKIPKLTESQARQKTQGIEDKKFATYTPPIISHEIIYKKETPAKVEQKPSGTQNLKTESGNFFITFYGWVDNDPPGKAIAYPKKYYPQNIHNQAAGIGTYENPVTTAAKKGIWPIGTKFYLPYLKKYVILEDICASCGENHLDVWMESDGAHEKALIKCEENWTRNNQKVVINPESNLQVDITPFYNTSTGECNNLFL